jgi:hypothetical protein
MVRTQISLTDAQMQRLRSEARRRGVPIAAVVRDAVDRMVPGGATDHDEAFSHALATAGRFDSVTGDVAARHDEIAGEADW